MKCTLNAELFTHIIDAIKDLNPHANFDFTEDGLHMQVMDTAHVSLSTLVLTKDSFQEYICENNIVLGLNLKSLVLVLRNSKGPLQFSSKGEKLHVNVQKNSGTAQYVLNLMEIECDQLGLPDVTYDSIAVLPSSMFARVVKDFSDISFTCDISVDQRLHVSACGDIGNLVWHSGDDCKCTVVKTTPALKFGIRYMCLFLKAASVSKEVILGLKADSPICVTFPVGSGHLRFYLAPRQEGDE